MHFEHLLRTLASTAVCVAGVSVLMMLILLPEAYSPLPFWDQWERVGVEQLLQNIFQPHNEHVVAIPRLFFAIDAAIFGGQNIFLLVLIQLIQFAHFVLLVWVARRAGLQGASLLTVGSLVAALLFCGAQMENFYWGFQVQFVLVYLLTTACFSIALVGSDRLRVDLAAVAVGIAASLTMSAGIIALPAAVVGSLFVQASIRRRLTLLCGAGVALLIFVALQEAGGGTDYAAALGHPISILYYSFAYLGGPFGSALAELGGTDLRLFGRSATDLAVLVGACGFVAALIAAFITLHRPPARSARVVLLLLVGAIIMSAFLTALGRWELGAPQALSSRYATPVFLFWSALTALYWTFAQKMPTEVSQGRLRLFFAVGTIAAIMLLLVGAPSWSRLAESQSARTEQAVTAVTAGVADPSALGGVYPRMETVLRQSDVLAAHSLSVFADPKTKLLNRPIAEVGTLLDPKACRGAIDRSEWFGENDRHEGWRIEGWAWSSKFDQVPNYMVFAIDEEVRGFGRIRGDRPDVMEAEPMVTNATTGYTGHARGTGPVVAYAAVVAGGVVELCEIGRT